MNIENIEMKGCGFVYIFEIKKKTEQCILGK